MHLHITHTFHSQARAAHHIFLSYLACEIKKFLLFFLTLSDVWLHQKDWIWRSNSSYAFYQVQLFISLCMASGPSLLLSLPLSFLASFFYFWFWGIGIVQLFCCCIKVSFFPQRKAWVMPCAGIDRPKIWLYCWPIDAFEHSIYARKINSSCKV